MPQNSSSLRRATDVFTTGIAAPPVALQLLRHVGDGSISAGQIGFVDHDDVGDFQNPGLFPLQFVAGLRLQDEHDNVGHTADRDVALTGANGFDKDAIEPETPSSHSASVRCFVRCLAGRRRWPGCG